MARSFGRESTYDSASQPAGGGESDFVTMTTRLGFLARDVAEEVAAEAARRNVSPSQIALGRGVLQPADADIVDTLMHPRQVVPGYEVLALLGRGGMGVVYRARQQSLGRLVALKTIHLSQLTNRVAVQRFEQEAKSLARLVHPHIVTAYDFGRHDERLYFVMELAEGEDVDQWIQRRGAMDERLVWQLIRQAASGLAHAARAGVVHRDVKPANLLLVTPPEGFPLPAGVPLVKIADFGLALLSEGENPDDATQQRLTSAGVHVGSPVYMAPEQMESGDLDHRADIFALGATAWHMLVGKPPLHGASLRQLIMLRLSKPTDPVSQARPSVSAATDSLVAAMLHPDRDQRLSDYEDLLRRIDGILGATGVFTEEATDVTFQVAAPPNIATAETVVFQTDSTREVSRRTWGRWAAATLGLAVVPIAAVLWMATRPPAPVRDLTGNGEVVALFNGESLEGWRMLGGEWKPDRGPEGGLVLSGKNGLISRVLPGLSSDNGQHFRVDLHVRLGEPTDTMAEVQFDFSPSDANRLVARVTGRQLLIGSRASDRGELSEQLAPPLSLLHDDGVTLRIERQRDHWWILLDGSVAAAVRPRHVESAGELRLLAEGGSVQFADLAVEQLVARSEQ